MQEEIDANVKYGRCSIVDMKGFKPIGGLYEFVNLDNSRSRIRIEVFMSGFRKIKTFTFIDLFSDVERRNKLGEVYISSQIKFKQTLEKIVRNVLPLKKDRKRVRSDWAQDWVFVVRYGKLHRKNPKKASISFSCHGYDHKQKLHMILFEESIREILELLPNVVKYKTKLLDGCKEMLKRMFRYQFHIIVAENMKSYCYECEDSAITVEDFEIDDHSCVDVLIAINYVDGYFEKEKKKAYEQEEQNVHECEVWDRITRTDSTAGTIGNLIALLNTTRV